MPVLFFSDLLTKVGLAPGKVKLIRHALSDKGFRSCYEKNMVLEYTRQQKPDFSRGYTHWAIFISDAGNYAKFYALYRVGPSVPDTMNVMPAGFPHPDWFAGKNAYFDLTPVDILGRWRCYVDSLHGNNKRMRQLLCDHPDRYQFFQFSILQLLPKTATDEEMIHTESLWKKKLLSIPFGMNDN